MGGDCFVVIVAVVVIRNDLFVVVVFNAVVYLLWVNFLNVQATHPTIAIGICLFQEEDMMKQSVADFPELIELESSQIFDDAVYVDSQKANGSPSSSIILTPKVN